MAEQTVLHGELVLPEGICPEGEIVIEGERIAEVNLRPTRTDPNIAWTDGQIFPGLIDLHIHGTAGFDVMDATDEALSGMDQALAQAGCTGYLATTMSAPVQTLEPVLRAVRRHQQRTRGSGLLGIHMEGPFIHPERHGAQRSDAVRHPDLAELRTYSRILGRLMKRLTLAPELPDADTLIEWCRRSGVAASAGHSNASYEEALQAFDQGVHQVTHLFNAMPPLNHREPGLAGAALMNPDVRVEVIADGVHLHPRTIEMVARLKGPRGVILVTDAMRAAGLGSGTFDLGGQTVSVADGAARLPDGSLAGSTLSLLRAVYLYQTFAGVELHEAVQAASLVPARSLGLVDRGAIEPGCRADLLLIDRYGVNRMTWRNGRIVFDGR